MSPELQGAITRLKVDGCLDVNSASTASFEIRPFRPRSAYLVLASCDMRVRPLSEVQVTTRCHQPFRGRKLVVPAKAARRFDLVDLKIKFRSQFVRAENLPLRSCVSEFSPDLIRWPMEVCGVGDEVCVRAIISEQEGVDDPGELFEMILLGESL